MYSKQAVRDFADKQNAGTRANAGKARAVAGGREFVAGCDQGLVIGAGHSEVVTRVSNILRVC